MPRITPEITENPLILVNGIVLLALTVLTAVFISLYASNVYKGNKKKAVLFFTVIAALTALSLFCFFGCAATTVKALSSACSSHSPLMRTLKRGSAKTMSI